jgi:lipid-binding SYLF domain-containing protein
MKTAISHLATGMVLWTMLSGTPAFAQTKSVLDAGVLDTVKQFNLIDSRHQDLEDRAADMLVFPQITKGGIGVASEYGEGALLVHGATADYYSIASASVGLTAGMATHSEIVRVDDYDSYKLKKPILVFTFAERGLIADVSLHGTKVQKIEK